MNKVIIFSPHSDDVALSLGGAIINGYLGKEILVYNIFSLSKYNIINHNKNNQIKTTKIRKAEEKKAMKKMGAKVIFLNYPESPLREKSTFLRLGEIIKKDKLFKEIKKNILEIINSNKDSYFYFPLGIGKHRDHAILSEIGLDLSKNYKKIIFYEDLPYSGEVSSLNLNKYVKKINRKFKNLCFPFLEINKKIKILKIYKSQFDAEDIYFTINHIKKRGGELIWGNEEDLKLIKLDKRYLDNGLLKNYEKLFNENIRINIISDYLNIGVQEVKKNMKIATENIAREWKYFKGINNEIEFYKTTKGYIFELEDWHIKDKMKQAGMVAISSSSKGKKILEYGCGTADISLLAALAGANEIHALDLPSQTLDFAKFKLKKLLGKKLDKVKFIKSKNKIDDLKLKKDYYDLVSAEDVFEHVTNPEKHAKKIYDSLKIGGSMFFSTEYVHSDFHPMHLEVNEKFNGINWLYKLENIGFKIVSPCQAIKNDKKSVSR